MLRGFLRHDGDYFFIATFSLEPDDTVSKSEKSIILGVTDIIARENPGSPLTNYNRTGRDALTAESLYSQPLAMRVASVLYRPLSLLVSQFIPLS
jgi:hypothetical protein